MNSSSNGGADYIGKIHEGRPNLEPTRTEKWIRLLVHQNPTQEDLQAERLFQKLAETLRGSEYGEYYILSIFRINPEQERYFGELPRVIAYPPAVGIQEVTRYLEGELRDSKAAPRSVAASGS